MPPNNVHIVINPGAGGVASLDEFSAEVRARIPEARIHAGGGDRDTRTLVTDALAEGCELLVSAGGDGTLHEVVNALAGRFDATALGLLPLGTGNDFARSIGVPATLPEALQLLIEGNEEPIDVVRITGEREHYMINVSGGGFAGKVGENMTDELRDTWGPLCYARSFFGTLDELEQFQTSIELDDRETIDVPAYNVIVANARYIAKGIPIAPRALLNDGLVDVIILPVKSLTQLALLAPAALLGKHLDGDQLLFHRARRVRITSQPAMRFNADGELLEKGPLTFEVLPGALRFVVGALPAE